VIGKCSVTKRVEIEAIDGGFEVRLIEDVHGKTHTKRRTICSSLAIAKSIAKSWSVQNGSCPIKEMPAK
jgi:hypothetical protein